MLSLCSTVFCTRVRNSDVVSVSRNRKVAEHTSSGMAGITTSRESLQDGPGKLKGLYIDAVLVNKQNNATASYCGRTAAEIVSVWQENGWHVNKETDELIVLVREGRKY